ncbi:DTW domain-containing protein [Blastocladiella britannica]|nr:DTW domain-containing protein [Blastocladiella britannica]
MADTPPLPTPAVVLASGELPHADLRISPVAPLLDAPRVRCDTCQDRVRYYCARCLVPRGGVAPPVMPVLPFVFDVFKHKHELNGKSTALHAKVLCPEDVRVWEYPNQVNAYSNRPDRTLVLYPSENATPISEIDPTSFSHVIVIDGTWYQAHQMVRDAPFLKDPAVRHVTFASPPKTKFWRFQQKSEHHLATIEAMWWLVREYMAAHRPNDDQHTFDDLLWYYTFQYQRILGTYNSTPDLVLNGRLQGDFRTDLERVRSDATGAAADTAAAADEDTA